MEALWVGVAVVAVIGLVTVAVCVSQWASARRAAADAKVRQDMLARGLSVDEIDRLTAAADVRKAQVAAEAQVRTAQVTADLTRDLVARGLPAAEVERLLKSRAPVAIQVDPRIDVLAGAVVSMVDLNGKLDREAVAGLLSAFLRNARDTRGGRRPGNAVSGLLSAFRGEETDGLAAAIVEINRAGNLQRSAVAGLLAAFLEKDTSAADGSAGSGRAGQTTWGARPEIDPGERKGLDGAPGPPGRGVSGRAEVVSAERTGPDWLVTLRVVEGVVRRGGSARLVRTVGGRLRLCESDLVQADTGTARNETAAGEVCATLVMGCRELRVGDVLELLSDEDAKPDAAPDLACDVGFGIS